MKFFENKNVVVTGASGLLGSHLVEQLLESGANVRAVVHRRAFRIQHPRLEVVTADLMQQSECDRVMQGMDCACLCASITVGAAQAVANPMIAVTSNLIMAAQSLQAASVMRVSRVLLVSSTTVYPAYARPVREDEAFIGEPHSAYQGVGNMKRYIEVLAKFYHDKYGLGVAIVRPVPYFGRNDNFDLASCHVIPALIRKAVEGYDPYEVWGTGDEVRDFLHVTDVARGSLLALERQPDCDALNLGSGSSMTIGKLAETILRLSGCTSKIVFNASKPSTIPIRVVDVEKSRMKIGFQASMSMEQGLSDTMEWFRSNYPTVSNGR